MTTYASDEKVLNPRGARLEARLVRLTGSPVFWVLFLGAIFAYPIARALTREMPKPPPVLVTLPEFTLTDQLGKPFGTHELEGKVWIANFIFTNCPSRCPMLTEVMRKVQKRLVNMGDAVYLVSFSVDPERDTPEKLAEYARKHQANPRRWRFLTGELAQVQDAVVKGFKMPMDPGVPPVDGSTLFDITHGTRFVLVDQAGRVRGFYETDDDSINQMLADMTFLVSARPEDATP